MITQPIYNLKGESVGEMQLSDRVFGQPANPTLVHQAVVAQRANARQVLAHTKDRSEVRGGGKKPWRQKGTGRARAGSNRSPLWVGGGITFGPTKNRNFSKGLNVKMKRQALRVVLSDKLNNKQVAIMDTLVMDAYKTKVFKAMIDAITNKAFSTEAKVSTLILDKAPGGMVRNSARNLVGIKLLSLDNINIVDLLKYRELIITKAAVEQLEEQYQK